MPDIKTAHEWLRELVNFGGAITGIILTAIGAIMLLDASLKLYVFGFDSNAYSRPEMQCNDQTRSGLLALRELEQPNADTQTADLAAMKEAREQCIEEQRQIERRQYRRSKQEDLVRGISFFIVGVPLWIMHRRRQHFSKPKKK